MSVNLRLLDDLALVSRHAKENELLKRNSQRDVKRRSSIAEVRAASADLVLLALIADHISTNETRSSLSGVRILEQMLTCFCHHIQ